MVEVNSAVGLWCVWIAMATGQLIWSTLPQLLLLLWRPADWESGENVTARVPVSSLLHRPFPEERRVHLRDEVCVRVRVRVMVARGNLCGCR